MENRMDLHNIRQDLLGIITTMVPKEEEALANKLYDIAFDLEREELKLRRIKLEAKEALKNL